MTILCYHEVRPGWASPLAVDPALFADQCAWLAGNRTVVPLADAVTMLDASGRLPRGVCALTFDDGFSGFHEHALPVLARFGLPATVFLVAQTLTARGQDVDWVDTPAPFPLTTLSVSQVKELQAVGGVSFGSHTYSHPDLTALSGPECLEELTRSRQVLEDLLGEPVPFLAYPRGRHDDAVRSAASRAGYSHAFTLPEEREPVGRYAVPRVGVYRDNSVTVVRIKSTRTYLPLRNSRVTQLGRWGRHRSAVAGRTR